VIRLSESRFFPCRVCTLDARVQEIQGSNLSYGEMHKLVEVRKYFAK